MHTTLRRMSFALLLVASLGTPTAIPAQESAVSALEIMRTQRERHRPHDEQETITMTLISRTGEEKQRQIVTYSLTPSPDVSKTLIRFLSPRDVENTALLTWGRQDGDDDQWLYLPATGRAKRIASGGKKSRFMGSDFAYEDLRPENLAVHSYTLAGSETVGGFDCHVIDAVPASERQARDSGYGRRRLWIRKDNYFTVQQEYYDKKNVLEKVSVGRRMVREKGTIWRAGEIEMRDVRAGSRTILLINRRLLDQGLDDALFTVAQMARRIS